MPAWLNQSLTGIKKRIKNMAKNTNKKAKFKEATFTINKDRFKELLALILKHNASYSTCGGGNILNGVQMTVKGNILTLAATDGNTLLELEAELDNTATNEGQAVLVGIHLEKLALKKDYHLKKRSFAVFDVLEITIQQENTIINDVRNQIKYSIPHYTGKFPDYEKLFPKNVNEDDDYTKFGVNMANFAKLVALTKRGITSVVAVKNSNSAVVVSTNYDGIKSRALVMPCVVRGLND